MRNYARIDDEGLMLFLDPGINRYYMVPFNPTSAYHGRRDILESLDKNCLPNARPDQLHKCYVLFGEKGFGKSQICLKFASARRRL